MWILGEKVQQHNFIVKLQQAGLSAVAINKDNHEDKTFTEP
jgi:hypothetical protein